MTEDVDPENPRPAGRYHVEADSTWYYVDDDLADTIATGPATDAEPGDDWILSFTAAGATDDDRERVCVRLTPRALHELYIGLYPAAIPPRCLQSPSRANHPHIKSYSGPPGGKNFDGDVALVESVSLHSSTRKTTILRQRVLS